MEAVGGFMGAGAATFGLGALAGLGLALIPGVGLLIIIAAGASSAVLGSMGGKIVGRKLYETSNTSNLFSANTLNAL